MGEPPPGHVALSGSHREPLAGAVDDGPSDPAAPVEVTLRLVRGAGEGALDRILAFAGRHRLSVDSADAVTRSVKLSGRSDDMEQAFGVTLRRFRAASVTYRGRTGPVHVPAEIAPDLEGVFGLDDRPQARTQYRVLGDAGGALRPHAVPTAYSPLQVGDAYAFPPGLDGAGQTIAFLELGGGYDQQDLHTYFHSLGITAPAVSSVSVDGAGNHPTGQSDGPDGEVLLDLEVAGALAPGAHLVCYFAPNSDRGFIDGVAAALHDPVRRPSVISISWGGPEPTWTPQALTALDSLFADAAALSVTVCCASGDNGSGDGYPDGQPHVDFPASSPNVLACGGTRLAMSGSRSAESVWYDGPGQGATGGGVSDFFPKPEWQAAAGVPPSANPGHLAGRGVPDVAGDADPVTGYVVRVHGQLQVVGGTSAVAPLWAALLARVNQARGSGSGFINPALYGAHPAVCNDVSQGGNGAWSARIGWDPCTGLGSPNGPRLLSLLTGR
ncbi:MAG: S53 family peptidase [Candidatus Dormibacteria bacterium]